MIGLADTQHTWVVSYGTMPIKRGATRPRLTAILGKSSLVEGAGLVAKKERFGPTQRGASSPAAVVLLYQAVELRHRPSGGPVLALSSD